MPPATGRTLPRGFLQRGDCRLKLWASKSNFAVAPEIGHTVMLVEGGGRH